MIEDFFYALYSFKTNKMRAILSLLGIIIGVTSVVIITTLGNSLQKSMEKEFSNASMDVLLLTNNSWSDQTQRMELNFNKEFRTTLLKRTPQIKNIFFVPQIQAKVARNSTAIGSKNIESVEPFRLEALGVEMDYGNFFTTTDYVNAFNKIIIGDKIAVSLFPEGNAVGKNITLQIKRSNGGQIPENINFEVCGVMKQGKNWLIQTSDKLCIPEKSFKKLQSIYNNQVFQAEVIIYSSKAAKQVELEIENVARELAPNTLKPIWIFSAQNQLEQASKIMNMVRLVIVSIAGISLLVGGIGIMNIMLVSVTERKKEIGIRKALGATNRAIEMQFLVESATLTLTGGVAGVVFGILLSKVIVDGIMPKDIIFHFDPVGTMIAFVVSVFIGVFFGLHPASKAAKLDPVVALSD